MNHSKTESEKKIIQTDEHFALFLNLALTLPETF